MIEKGNEYLAVDIGASSGRHVLGRFRNGRLELSEIYRFPNAPTEKNGRLVWNLDRLFREILNGMKRAKQLGHAPVSVGVDTWAVDYVLLDRDGKSLGEAICYRDPSVGKGIDGVHARFPFEELYRRTGIQFQPFNSVYRFFTDGEEGRLARAERLLMLPDYFHFLLSGECSREYTNATSTGLIDPASRSWDRELLSGLGLPERLFPTPASAGTRLGPLRKELEEEIGYRTEVVLPATHDTASAVIGSSAKEGELYLSSGTWSLLGSIESAPRTGEMCRRYNYSNEGHIGGKVRFQKNITGLWIVQQLRREECPSLSFGELTELARLSPVDGFVDVNDERFRAPARMKAELETATGRELSLGEATYCALYSLARGYKQAVEEYETATGRRTDSLLLFGGGSRNSLLNELTEKETGRKVVLGAAEATAAGNLISQMVSAGEIGWSEANGIRLTEQDGGGA